MLCDDLGICDKNFDEGCEDWGNGVTNQCFKTPTEAPQKPTLFGLLERFVIWPWFIIGSLVLLLPAFILRLLCYLCVGGEGEDIFDKFCKWKHKVIPMPFDI